MPQVGRCASTSERPSAEAAGKDALPFPVPANECARSTSSIVPPKPAYDEIARLAAQIWECPIGYISFIDDDRRWLKAQFGTPPEITDAPRAAAVCSTAICGSEMLLVSDMVEDPRFAHTTLVVNEPH